MGFDSIKHNGTFDIALGRNRKETSWKNREWKWSDFLEKVHKTFATPETLAEYMAATPARQDEIKDIGGFVGGFITNGRRKKGSVMHRQLLTLDMDAGMHGVWDNLVLNNDFAACVYTTHKHTPEKPRLRIIIPLDRPVPADEYQAISRKVAGDLNIEAFDPTTFQPERLMYWPSTSKGAEFLFNYQDGPWLSADEVLASYTDWKDTSSWPVSEKVDRVLRREMKKAGDPHDKPGNIGRFCRRYTVTEAIEKFLSDVYEPCVINEGRVERFTYLHGSTAAGLIIYEDLWAYSHHGTDPAGGKLCNAFDLVRLHYFGLQDDDTDDRTAANRLPSYTSMNEFCSKDPGVKMQIGMEAMAQAEQDFGGPIAFSDKPDEAFIDEDGQLQSPADVAEIDTSEEANQWLAKMDTDKKGKYYSTIDNILLVLENDPRLKGLLVFNDFEKKECCLGDLPWRKSTGAKDYLEDVDDAGIRHYLERVYGITGQQKIFDALQLSLRRNKFHPVREFLNSLEWDGRERLDTLLIDYLGAEDNDYTRAVTRKTFIAAVARIYRPGIKFDTVLTLMGPQGIGKSTLIAKMFMDWYTDSFSGIGSNQAYEQIQGVWGVEIAELAALKKAELETIKHFISKTEDRFRVAYGRKAETFVRQCVFIATHNPESLAGGFLKDQTGNRRWWPVMLSVQPIAKTVFSDMTESEVLQVWAEAVVKYRAGEKIYLTGVLAEKAAEVASEHTEMDERAGLIAEYLNMPVPVDWAEMELYERRAYVQAYNRGELVPGDGSYLRNKVCAGEIWCECIGGHPKDMTTYNTKPVHALMHQMAGWKKVPATLRFPIYGSQRGYIRANSSEDMLGNRGTPMGLGGDFDDV